MENYAYSAGVDMTQDEIIEMWNSVIKYAPSEVRITEFAHLVAAKERLCQGEHMKLYGYVWTKDKHEPKFFWTESPAKEIQKSFGGEVVAVYK
jgi:hypothetical protein